MKLVEAALTGLLIVLLCCATGIAQDGQTEFKQSHELDTMVVTANRTQENLRNVSQNITIFTAKDIQRSGADSVTDLLKKVGIQVYSDGAASYGNEGVLQASHDFGLFSLVAGVDWMSYEFDQRQDGEGASLSTQNTAQSDFDNIGGFLLAKMYLLEKKNLTLSAGIRYDNFDVSVNAWKKNEDLRISREIDKNSLTPSLGIAYSPMDVLKLRANYARAFKMPLPRQLTGYTIMMSTPFVGNPDIEPEKSDNFDFGFDLDWNALFFSATWFYSDYQDMIGYETHNADAHYNGKHYWYYNVDSAEIQGIETGVRFNIAQYLGYNFQLEPYLYWTHLLVFEDDNGWNLPDRAKDSLPTGLVFASKESGLTASLDLSKF